MAIAITSTVFTQGAEIPTKYTCEGSDTSPPLVWTGAPASAKSFALVVDDPDAPDPQAPKMTWVHWVLYDIPPTITSFAEGASTKLPSAIREGVNDWKRTGWGGPCPPIGRHRYFFKLFALDAMLGDLGMPTKDSLLQRMEGHVLAQAELMGTYQKKTQ